MLGGVVGSWGRRAGEEHDNRVCDARAGSGLGRLAPLERCGVGLCMGILDFKLWRRR